MTAQIVALDVNEALPEAAHNMKLYGEKRSTRNGTALVIRGVHTTVFQNPKNRVLFSPARDANPFFHLMETIWMLAGRNDVAFPTLFNSTFGDYSDDGIRFTGAYGYRWRKWFDTDQIANAIHTLASDTTSRRVVVQMYDARSDIAIAERGGKDIPCNLALTFHLWQEDMSDEPHLDMVVFNRSNDLIWGAYGSNVVHFSMLQQLVAEALNAHVGEYAQVSANTHVYERHWKLLDELAEQRDRQSPYESTDVVSTNLILRNNTFRETHVQFLKDCGDFCDRALEGPIAVTTPCYETAFFNRVVVPLMRSWLEFKNREEPERIGRARQQLLCLPGNLDWNVACDQWLQRRKS